MTSTVRLVLLGALIVLTFDAVGATASRALGFPYASLTIVSFAIFGTVCFYIGRRGGILPAVLGGAVLGLIDATLGWAIDWAIGPVGVPKGVPSLGRVLGTIVFVVVLTALLGLVGGVLGWSLRGRGVDA